MRFNWRHQYDDEVDEQIGLETATINNELSLTQQNYTADADINILMERMGVTHEMALPKVPLSNNLLDFSDTIDFRGANDRVLEAKNYFMALPARLRNRFDNDPQKLLAFVINPDNLEESIKLGFLTKQTQEPPPAPLPGPVSSGT